jgi:hypothetical protein
LKTVHALPQEERLFAMSKLFIALDADTLLAIAQGADKAEGAIDVITTLRGFPVVTPSVLQELQDAAENDSVPEDRHWAQLALTSLTTWGMVSTELDQVQRDIVEITTSKIVGNADLLDCRQSTRIIVEAAMVGCRLLLTYRGEVLSVDYRALKLALLQADLTDCISVTPDMLVEFFHEETA